MKDFVNIFGLRYSAVSTNDAGENCETTKSKKNPKSLKPKSALARLTILDSFFHQREAGKRARYPKCVFLLLAAGLCLISSSIFILVVQPYDLIFKWKLVFSDGGEIYNIWKTPPVELYIKIYLYNITNSEQFLNGSEKMNIAECGPYVYRELLSHENITFNDNGTLSATPSHPLIWQEHMSEGRRENDVFMLPNIALLSIAQVAAPKSYFFRLPINLVIRNTNSQPIVRTTAKEFMFGYETALTTLGNKLLPNWIYFEKVGLIDRMYDFEGDFATFFSGETEPSSAGLYDTYKGSTNLTQWKGSHCSNIQGASDGTKFKSFIQENETLLFFRKNMCRPQRLTQEGSRTTVKGLEAVKYKFENNALDNGHHDKKNLCFCRKGDCLPAGLVDVADCYYGFPIALSFPHFLDSDQQLINNITGSSPNRSRHESYFLLNPISGLPLKLSVKFQINLAMRDVSNMAHVEQFSNIVIPMLWFEISMPELPQSLQNRFMLYLNFLPVLEKIGLYGGFICGTFLTVFAITRAAMKLSTTLTASKNISGHKYSSSPIYNACEEKLMSGGDIKRKFKHKHNNEPEEEMHIIESVIGRCDFDLENEAALSDIEYDEDKESFDEDISEHCSLNSFPEIRIGTVITQVKNERSADCSTNVKDECSSNQASLLENELDVPNELHLDPIITQENTMDDHLDISLKIVESNDDLSS